LRGGSEVLATVPTAAEPDDEARSKKEPACVAGGKHSVAAGGDDEGDDKNLRGEGGRGRRTSLAGRLLLHHPKIGEEMNWPRGKAATIKPWK
jgi:hypothetical protein